MEITIRQGTSSDIEALLKLNHQIGAYHHAQAPDVFAAPSPEERQFLLNALHSDQRHFFVAEQGGQVIGFLSASITTNEAVPFLVKTPICRVGTIVVDEAYRSNGVGKILMAACKTWAMESGASEIRLEVMAFNDRAVEFYRSLGMHVQSYSMSESLQ